MAKSDGFVLTVMMLMAMAYLGSARVVGTFTNAVRTWPMMFVMLPEFI